MTTMRDVARLAGVSAKTVSRVFNDDPHVAADTRERVRWAMTKLDYVPNMLARSFRAGSDAAVGVAVPDIADPFFAAVIRGVERVAFDRGAAVVITSLGDDPARERPTVETLLRRQLAGLVAVPVSRDQSYLAPWLGRTPVVFVDRSPSRIAADVVVDDDRGGAIQAVEHLLRHGHTAIGFVGSPAGVATNRQRLAGYRAALAGHGLARDPSHVVLDSGDAQATAARAVALLARPAAPTALFCANAHCTLALIPALQRAGRTDVALVAFGDFPMAAALRPAVTVIDQNPDGLGRLAAEKLFSRMAGPPGAAGPRRKTVVPVRLIARGSGELPPTPSAPSAEQPRLVLQDDAPSDGRP